MKIWDDNLLSLNINKLGNKGNGKLSNTMKEVRCQDILMDISKG